MAEYALEVVQSLASEGSFRLKVTRCQESIIKFFGCSASEARLKFAEIVAAMTNENFSKTVEQRFGQKFDEYGFMADDGTGWYLKIAVDVDASGDEELIALSCHPLERPILTKGGRIEP